MQENKDLHNDLKNKLDDVKAAKSIDLAAHVVLYKALGLGKELAKACMIELGIRRIQGEDFPFESYIEEELKKVPKPNAVSPILNINKLIKSFVKVK